MLVTIFGCWRQTFVLGDTFWILFPDAYVKIVDVDNQNSQKRHQHLKVSDNIFCLQHPSPTSMLPKLRCHTEWPPFDPKWPGKILSLNNFYLADFEIEIARFVAAREKTRSIIRASECISIWNSKSSNRKIENDCWKSKTSIPTGKKYFNETF